jgi:hypothetical protein
MRLCCLQLLFALVAISRARAAVISWQGNALSAAGEWSTAANWLPAQVPAAGDSVTINTDSNYTVDLRSSVALAELTIISGTLQLWAASPTVSSLLNFTGGAIANGNVSASAVTLTALSTCTTVLTSSSDKQLTDVQLLLQGGATWASGSLLLQGTAAQLTVASGAQLSVTANTTIQPAAAWQYFKRTQNAKLNPEALLAYALPPLSAKYAADAAVYGLPPLLTVYDRVSPRALLASHAFQDGSQYQVSSLLSQIADTILMCSAALCNAAADSSAECYMQRASSTIVCNRPCVFIAALTRNSESMCILSIALYIQVDAGSDFPSQDLFNRSGLASAQTTYYSTAVGASLQACAATCYTTTAPLVCAGFDYSAAARTCWLSALSVGLAGSVLGTTSDAPSVAADHYERIPPAAAVNGGGLLQPLLSPSALGTAAGGSIAVLSGASLTVGVPLDSAAGSELAVTGHVSASAGGTVALLQLQNGGELSVSDAPLAVGSVLQTGAAGGVLRYTGGTGHTAPASISSGSSVTVVMSGSAGAALDSSSDAQWQLGSGALQLSGASQLSFELAVLAGAAVSLQGAAVLSAAQLQLTAVGSVTLADTAAINLAGKH